MSSLLRYYLFRWKVGLTYDLRSFAFGYDLDVILLFDIYKAIQDSRYYFYKFCGCAAEEAMHLTLFHALVHYKPENGDMGAYVRSLARTILKDRYANTTTPVDFIEDTTVDTGRSASVEDEVLDEISEVGCYEEVSKLALTCMSQFVVMCDSLERKDTSTLYVPDYFISECLSLQSRYSSFFSVCKDIYDTYKDDFLRFIEEDKSSGWTEANFTLINGQSSSRIAFISNATGKVSEDPDLEDCIVRGSLGTKHIISVPYVQQLNKMCNLIDEEGINAMRFTIGDEYILRTLGGSVSVLSPSLFNEYDLCEAEILTNLIRDTNGRYLGKGSKNMYFLVSSVPEIPSRCIRGVTLSFDVNLEL